MHNPVTFVIAEPGVDRKLVVGKRNPLSVRLCDAADSDGADHWRLVGQSCQQAGQAGGLCFFGCSGFRRQRGLSGCNGCQCARRSRWLRRGRFTVVGVSSICVHEQFLQMGVDRLKRGIPTRKFKCERFALALAGRVSVCRRFG